MIIISRRFKFDSAHHLKYHDGKCKNIHGHSYKCEIKLKGKIDPKTGMLLDFSDFKEIVKKHILNKVDHKNLNDVYDFEPTAENLAEEFFYFLYENHDWFYKLLYSVKVWETEDCYAEYNIDLYLEDKKSG